MWIFTKPINAFTSTTTTPYFIDEWDLTFTQGVGFSVVYNRRINVSNSLAINGVNWGLGNGFTALDNNTLIGTRYLESTVGAAGPTNIIQIDISSPGNITLNSSNIITLFSLPTNGSTITINDGPNVTLTHSNNPAILVVSGNMVLTDNDKLIVKGKMVNSTGGNVKHILLQYDLDGTLEHARDLGSYGGLYGPVRTSVFNYDGNVLITKVTGQVVNYGPFEIQRYNNNQPLTSSLGQTELPDIFPGVYRPAGVMNSSSPRFIGGDNPCGTQDLPVNVTGIIPG